MTSNPTPLDISAPAGSALDRLALRLAAFGFAVPQAVVRAWSAAKLHTIERCTTQWEIDYEQAMGGHSKGEAERITVPRELAAYEVISAKLACQARDHGHRAATSNGSSDCNPYPLGTALSKIWSHAFNSRSRR